MDNFELIEKLEIECNYLLNTCKKILNYGPEDKEEWDSIKKWYKEELEETSTSISSLVSTFLK